MRLTSATFELPTSSPLMKRGLSSDVASSEVAEVRRNPNIRKKLGLDKPMGMHEYAVKRGWIAPEHGIG